MARRRPSNLPAPFLKRVWLDATDLDRSQGYPFNLPWLVDDFELEFTTPVTILMGENGTGKSTLLEAVAALSGYDEAGGGKGYRAVDHAQALDKSGSGLADLLRAGWLPKVTDGWFFRAESFFSVARYMDAAAKEAQAAGQMSAIPPDFLSWSHGEGFLRFFEERMARQGIYFLDEPESALSPQRQLDLIRLLTRVQETARAQVIMATHSPMLMAVPNARVLQVTRLGLFEVDFRATRHFEMYQNFTVDPEGFIAEALREDE